MYSINVTGYRAAEDDEIGTDSKLPTVEIVLKWAAKLLYKKTRRWAVYIADRIQTSYEEHIFKK